MKNIDKKISEVDNRIAQIKTQLEALDIEKAALVSENELAKRSVRTKEQIELVKLRESIKALVDEFNTKAVEHNIDVGVGLLTTGGHNIYELDEDGESEYGEYFSDREYEHYYTQYGRSEKFWFPSSLNC